MLESRSVMSIGGITGRCAVTVEVHEGGGGGAGGSKRWEEVQEVHRSGRWCTCRGGGGSDVEVHRGLQEVQDVQKTQ